MGRGNITSLSEICTQIDGILSHSLPVYKYIVLRAPALAAISVPLSNSTTRQSIVLESCSNPHKMRQVF